MQKTLEQMLEKRKTEEEKAILEKQKFHISRREKLGLLHQKKEKIITPKKENKMVISNWFVPITLSWFFLSILLGWMTSMFFEPFEFLVYLYADYYNLICLSNFAAFFLGFVAAYYYIKIGFLELSIKKGRFFYFAFI